MTTQLCRVSALLLAYIISALFATPTFSQPNVYPTTDGEYLTTDGEYPTTDGELLLDEKIVQRETVRRIPFNGTTRLKYGIKRTINSHAGPGAIVVKVTKVYEKDNQSDWTYADLTKLYRNKSKRLKIAKYNGEIKRAIYNKYHESQTQIPWIISPTLSNFHIKFAENEKTNEPPNRRHAFLHGPIGEKVVGQNSYILTYKAIPPEGTWIPFDVNFDRAYSMVYISVLDLGVQSIGDGPFERTWTVKPQP